MPVSYEWNIEIHKLNDEDIQDNIFEDVLSESTLKPNQIDGNTLQLVLVKNIGNSEDGLISRDWTRAKKSDTGFWYLPEKTQFGHKVPKKYHLELAAWQV